MKKFHYLYYKKRFGADKTILTKRGGAEKVLFGIVAVIFGLYALSLIMPFLYMLLWSLKDDVEYIDDLITGQLLALPDNWKFGNYVTAFSQMKTHNTVGQDISFIQMTINSIMYVGFSIVSSMTANVITGYVVSKYNFFGKNFFYGLAVFCMTIPIIGTSGAMMKLIYDIGLYNMPILPLVTSFGSFGMTFLILYGFFKNLSWSYAEAAFIDGASDFTAFVKVMLPQSFPMLMTLSIMSFIGSWNDYMTPMLYLPDWLGLATGIYNIQAQIAQTGNYPVLYASMMFATLPVIIIFASFSDMIMGNLSIGGLKG